MISPDPSGQPAAASALTPLPPHAPDAPAVVAFYLPQYHQIPENDEWWGEGFTDWVNVAAARPLYPGHPVPHVPSELGAYDLRSQSARTHQAELAREHGVYGFCYYFYWFGGRRLLEQPLELMLADGQPSLPFCLCWANEPWTRRWDGRESDILMPQRHERVRDLAILDDLMPYFEDERYIRIDGRPLLLVYRPGLMGDAAGFASGLREGAARRGLPGMFLASVMSVGNSDRKAQGFDAAVEFPPNGTIGREIDPRTLAADASFRGRIYDYATVVEAVLARPMPALAHFPGVMPRWDNTARKGMGAHVFHGSTPELFERWLRRAATITRQLNPRAPLVFVNSWNEWAEGAHLEPDEQAGKRYLEATRRVVSGDASGLPDGAARDVVDDASASTGPPMPTREKRGAAATRVALLAGMPQLGEATQLSVSDGVGCIDSVDGRPLHGHIIPAGHQDPLSLHGWFYGDSRAGGRRGGLGYLILSTDGTAWHAPITERYRRPDVLRGMVARDRLRRRIVRTIDRLPHGIELRVLRIWAKGRDRFGFTLHLRLDDLPPGPYRVSFVDMTRSGSHLVDTEFVVDVG